MTLSSLIASGLFGLIGFAFFIYGKKQLNFRIMIVGIIMMIYPYFVSSVLLIYLIGIALLAFVFIFR